MEAAEAIRRRRLEIWRWYNDAFAGLERREILRRPVVLPHCGHNAHMFYVLVRNLAVRTHLLATLSKRGINAVFHFVPLHSSEGGRRFGRSHGSMHHTESVSDRLVRLPLWVGMGQLDVDRVVTAVGDALG